MLCIGRVNLGGSIARNFENCELDKYFTVLLAIAQEIVLPNYSNYSCPSLYECMYISKSVKWEHYYNILHGVDL